MKKRRRPRFNFTPAEWREIRSAVSSGCTQPSRFSESGLVGVARDYLEHLPHHRSPSERAAAWKRVARLLGEVRRAMVVADPLGWFENVAPHFEDPPRPAAPEYGVSDELARWQSFSELLSRAGGGEALHPRLVFFRSVFDYWLEAGGRLRLSRAGPESADRGKLGGPTIRYLQAVSGPVMGTAAPTAEGLRKILERRASEFEHLLTEDGELAAVIHAVQVGADVDVAARTALSSPARGGKRRKFDRIAARQLVRGGRRAVGR